MRIRNKSILVIAGLMLVAVVGLGVLFQLRFNGGSDEPARSDGDPTVIYGPTHRVFDHTYDDSWIAKLPDHIGGYELVWIGTPRTVACIDGAWLSFRHPEGLTADSPGVRINYAALREEILRLAGRDVDLHLDFYAPPPDGWHEWTVDRNIVNVEYGGCGWGRMAAPAPKPSLSAGDDTAIHGPVSEVFDNTFDDSWISKMPARMGEYEIATIKTPRTYACSIKVVIHFRAPQETLEEYLANPPDIPSIRDQITDIIGPEIDFDLSFGRSELTVEDLEQKIFEWNKDKVKTGCR